MERTSNLSYSHSLLNDPSSSPRPCIAPTSPSQAVPLLGQKHGREIDPLIINVPTSTHTVPPTPSQQQALTILGRFCPSEVLAWLRILRCLDPGYQHNGASGELSARELEAASELKVCTDDRVLPWLELANRAAVARGSPTPLTSTPSLPTNPSLNQRISRHKSQSFRFGDTSTFVSSSIHTGRTGQSTLASSLSNGTTRSRNPATEVASTTSSEISDHAHWCTICEQSKVYKTCDGWKRHMREHEIIYPCMPNGPVSDTGSGPRCCFCGSLNPTQEHLDKHSVSRCHGGFEDAQKYSRRINLIKHIEDVHHASKASASALANEWQNSHKRKRKFFSCGFCVTIFSTLKDQNSHVDKEHWSQHQDITAWDTTKVILGLLRQTGVSESWQELLAKHDIRSDSNSWPCWHPTTSEDLQLNLEIGQGSAQALAQLAFKQSSYCQSRQVELTPGTASQRCDEDFEIEGNTSASQNAGITMQVPQFCSASQRDYSSEINHFLNRGSSVALYHDAAGKPKPDSSSSQYDSLQPINAISNNFFATDIDEGADYYSENPMDQLELPPNDTGNMMDRWETQAVPWTPLTPTERQINEGGAPHQPLFGEITQGNHQSPYSPTPVGISPKNDAYRSGSQVQNDSLVDTRSMHNSLPYTDDAPPIITMNAPVRKRPPHLVARPKRKLSGLNSSDHGFMIDIGNNPQYRYDDDHVRSRRRTEDEDMYHT